MEFLSLLKINNIYLIQLLFLINFLIIFFISYPIGRLLSGNNNSKNLLFCSIISVSTVSIVIAISLNVLAVLAKYLVICFLLLNVILFFFNKNIFHDLLTQIKKNKILLLSIFLVYFLISNIFYPIYLQTNFVEVPYSRHLIYYFSPIQEIFKADYFSRIRLTNLYPMEWAAFYFFQASFNSIYLNFFSNFGYLGLLFLKCFFFSLFFCNLSFYLYKKIEFKKNNIVLSSLLLLNVFYYLFFVSNINWFVFGNGTIVVFAIFFLFKNFYKGNVSASIFSCILFVLASFKNILISSLIYYFFSVKNNKHLIFLKLKLLGINSKHLLLIVLLFLYLSMTFFSSENVFGKFHILGSYGMWETTFTYNIISNSEIFLIFSFMLILLKFLTIKKYALLIKNNKFENIFLIVLIILIPLFSYLIFNSKEFILNFINNSNLKIFLNSFTYDNLRFYFLVPVFWVLLLNFQTDKFAKFIFALIVIHTGLSIFIHNHLILPAFYALEIFFIFWMIYIFLEKKTKSLNKIRILLILFVINSTFFISNGNTSNERIKIKLDDLSKFNNKAYICPNDLKNFKDYENIVESDLLSGLMNKRFYTNLAYDKKYNYYDHFDLATPMAISPNYKFYNPCRN